MLSQRQTLGLHQTQSPQQVLLSTLLQLPILRLEQRIKIELQENPLLEEVLDEEMEMGEDAELSMEEEKPEEAKETEESSDAGDEEKEEDIDWDLLGGEDDFEFKIPKDPNVEEFERPNVSKTTLSEHLLQQLHVIIDLTELDAMIGEDIIWNINEDGYLETDLEEITLNLEVPVDEVKRVLKIIQTFEPVGIGARNLRECLLIQLEQDNSHTAAKEIINDYFDDFKNKRFEKISKKPRKS